MAVLGANLLRRTPRRSLAFALIALTAAVAAGVWFAALRPVAVVVAERAAATPIEVFGLGTVEARIVSRVGFESAGIITELHADAGQRVARGQLLARLRADDQQARLAVAEAAAAQAEATITQAQANHARAQAQARQRLQVAQRRHELLRRGAISDEIAQEAQTAHEMAAAESDQAAAAVAVAVANLAQARAAHALEAAGLDKLSLRAPFDAIVMQRHRELGAAANPGDPILSLVDPGTVWVLAHVDEAAAGGLAIGQHAVIRLRSLPRRDFVGRIVRIEIESDRVTEERRVHLACDNCPRDFFLGEQAEIVVRVGEIADALFLPRAALVAQHGNAGRAWAVRDGRLTPVEITLGARTLDGRLEIVSPLPTGVRLVASRLSGDVDGRRTRIVRDPP